MYTHIILLLYTHIGLATEEMLYTRMLSSGCRETEATQNASRRLRKAQTSGCGAASSAPRSGRGGRRCKPCHPDHEGAWCNSSTAVSKTVRCPCNSGGPCQPVPYQPAFAATHSRPPPAAVAGRGSCASSSSQASSAAPEQQSRSCPGPQQSDDRIAQQRERRRALAKLARSA